PARGGAPRPGRLRAPPAPAGTAPAPGRSRAGTARPGPPVVVRGSEVGPVDSISCMRATAQPLEDNKVKLSVEVDEAEFERALNDAFRKMAREVKVPGFRPGKVPRRLLEARLGTGVLRQEAFRESLPDFYARALEDADVDAIAAPEIEITAGQESGPVVFDAVVPVRPVVTIPGYQGLRL